MLSQFVLRPACLQRHLALNGTTWDDPADIKVRASSGLGAADAFGPLNLWGELMANLAILGYDETSLRLLGFDWRLSAQRLEARDGFFTQVKAEVELLGALSGAKVAVLAHSLGANHFVHFMRWVEAREPGWVERRVARFVPICGALLGSAKALAYLVTGEMTDAVGMGPLLAQLFESHGGIQRRAVADLTRSWASVPALLPKGGDAFWRTDDFVVLDEPPADVRAALERDAAANGTVAAALLAALATNRTMAVDAALDWLRAMLPAYGALLDGEYDLTGPPAAGRRRRRPPLPARAWGNGLLAPLPKAPSLEIYCLYGTGRSTPKTFEFAWTRPPRAAPAFDDARPPRPPLVPFLRPPRDAEVPPGPRALPRHLRRGRAGQRRHRRRRRRHGADPVPGLPLRVRLRREGAEPGARPRAHEGVRARAHDDLRRPPEPARHDLGPGQRQGLGPHHERGAASSFRDRVSFSSSFRDCISRARRP